MKTSVLFGWIGTLTILAGPAIGQTPPAATPSNAPARQNNSADADVVQLSEFQVRESTDRGYAAQYTLGGSRINMEISKTPISVVVFNEEFRYDTASLDIQEIARFSAGVTGSANIGSGQLSLRGQNLSGSTFRDGIPGNTNAGEAPDYVDLSTVERVEVIKGPAGTLFGAHSSGGMVNYVTKRPKRTRQTTLYGMTQPNRHLFRLEADDSRPLGGGWAYRAILAYQEGTTLIGTRNDVRNGQIALSKTTRWASFLVRVSRMKREWLNSGPWFVDVANNVSTFRDITQPTGEVDGVRHHNSTGLDLEAEFKVNLGGLVVKNRLVGRYTDSMMDTYNYSSGEANHRFLNAAGVAFGTAANSRLDDPRLVTIEATRAANLREFDQAVWAINYDAVVEFTTGPAAHKALIYGEATQTKRDAGIYSATYAPINLMAPVYYFPNTAARRGPWIISSNMHFETFGYAVAVQDNISLWQERLILVAGARYDYAINDTLNKITQRYTRADDSRDGVTHKWAAVYRPRDDLTLYYNFSETFQPTSTNIGGVVLPNIESTNHELGVKVALADGRLSATASYFDITTDNLVIGVPVVIPATGAITTQSLPVGRRDVEGWEADFTANLGKGVSLLGGIGQLRSRTETGLRARGVADGLNYRIFGRWNLPQFTTGTWFVGAGYEHTGKRPVDTLATYLLPDMDIYDALVGWRHRGLTLQANIGNVFDKIVPRAGTTRADIMPTEPRSIRLSARWTF
jgi:iron complex outermembrane receptor protein